MQKLWICTLVFFTSFRLLADYAAIPTQQMLNLKLGLDYSASTHNIDSDGYTVPIRYQSFSGQIRDFVYWLEPEYGLAEGWSVGTRLRFLSGSLVDRADNGAILTGSGITDSPFFIKWNFLPDPIVTLEIFSKLPLGSSNPSTTSDLVTGEGNFDFGLKFHTAIRTSMMSISITPGILWRMGGYSSAFLIDGALDFRFSKGYLRGFMNYQMPFSETNLYSSSVDTQTATGAGGSFMRLAGSPMFLFGGGKIGINVYESIFLEGGYGHTIVGARAPEMMMIFGNILITFDFYQAAEKEELKEVPFEGEKP